MAIINTTVAKSRDVRDAALNLNAKAFEVRRTLAAVWDLKPTGAKPPPPEAAFSLDMKNESGEVGDHKILFLHADLLTPIFPSQSVVGEGDERIKVNDVHFAPGGKYRCKIQLESLPLNP